MRFYLHLFLLCCALTLCLCLDSCRPDSVCRLNTEVLLGVGVQYFTRQEIDGSQKNIEVVSWDSVSIQGLGSDSVLYDNDKGASILYFYLRSDTSQTQYVLQWHNKKDTLTLTHNNKFEFISMACGCIVDYTIQSLSYTSHFIDTIYLLDSEVNLTKKEHIKLRLR